MYTPLSLTRTLFKLKSVLKKLLLDSVSDETLKKRLKRLDCNFRVGQQHKIQKSKHRTIFGPLRVEPVRCKRARLLLISKYFGTHTHMYMERVMVSKRNQVYFGVPRRI